MNKINKIFDWMGKHSIFVYGSLATMELLWYIENFLKDD